MIACTVAQIPGEMKRNAVLKMDMEECSGQMDCKTCEKSLKSSTSLDVHILQCTPR